MVVVCVWGLVFIHGLWSVYIMVTSILRGDYCCCLPGMMTHVEYFHIYENVHIYKHENKATQPPCLLLLIHASCRCRLWQISGIISICQVDNNTTPEYRDIYEYLSSSAMGAVILMVVVVTRLDQGN